MDIQLAPGLKQKTADKFVRHLSVHLIPGEHIQALATASQFRPILDGLAVTNLRILAFLSGELKRSHQRYQ